MRLLFLVLLLLFATRAQADQVDRWVSESEGERRYHVVWEDARGERTDTSFALPLALVERDRMADEGLSASWMGAIRASAIKEWSATLPAGESVKSVEIGGSQRLLARAPTAARRTWLLEQARAAGEAATESAMKTLGRIRDPEGVYRIDLAGMAAEYAPQLGPLASALKTWSDTPQAFVARTLHFVQSIPYESRQETFWGEPILTSEEQGFQRTGYTAFRRPGALLDENLGDCDGKTVLFLAILRARYPELALAAVRIPGHVFGGVVVPGWDPGASFEAEGLRFTVVDPTGPGLRSAGSWSQKTREASRTVFVLPASD